MCADNHSIEILKIEYSQVCSKLQYLDDQANKYVSYILAFIGALAAFLGLLIKDGEVTNPVINSLIISAGTLIIGLLIIMTLHHTVQCFRLGGYIKFLEAEINRYLGHDLLKWESQVAPKYIHKDFTTFLIYFIMGIIFVALLTGAGWLCVLYILPIWPFGTVLLFAIGFLEIFTGVVYLIKALTVHERTSKIFTSQAEIAETEAINTEST